MKIKIKSVYLKARIFGYNPGQGSADYWHSITIDKITNEKRPNTPLFFQGSYEMTREEAVALWKKYYKGKNFSQEIKEFNYDVKDYCDLLEKSIDENTMYIEDGKQQEEAEKNNERIINMINKIKKL